jgi:hypothetical protein
MRSKKRRGPAPWAGKRGQQSSVVISGKTIQPRHRKFKSATVTPCATGWRAEIGHNVVGHVATRATALRILDRLGKRARGGRP